MLRYVEFCLRWVLWTGVFFLLAIGIAAYSGSANQWISTTLSASLSEAAGMPVEVQGASLQFPLKINAARVSYGTAETPVFTIQQLSINWNVHELLRGNLVVRSLEADSCTIGIFPASPSTATAEQSAMPTKRFSVDELHVHRLQLSPAALTALGRELPSLAAAPWQLHGSCQFDGHQALKAAFLLQDVTNSMSLEGTLYGTSTTLSVETLFKTPQMQIGDRTLPSLAGQLHVITDAREHTGHFQAAGIWEQTPIELSADFSLLANDLLDLSAIVINTPQARAQGQLQTSIHEQWITGTIQADAIFDAAAAPHIAGNASLALHFSRDAAAPIKITCTFPLLENAAVRLEDVLVQATLADLWMEPRLDAHISLGQIKFPQRPLEGSIAGNGTLSGPLAAPSGQFEWRLTKVMDADERWAHLPPLDGTLQLALADGQLACQGQLTSQAIPAGNFYGTIPCAFSLAPFHAAIDRSLPLAGQVDVQGELCALLQLFFPDLTLLSGEAHASAQASGSLDEPHYRAAMDIQRGLFEIGATGTVLRNLSAHMECDGAAITLTELTADDGAAGKVQGHGSLTLDAAGNLPFSILFDVQDCVLWHQDYAAAAFTGHLEFQGNTQEAKLLGATTCQRADISIPDRDESLVNTVEVTYVNQPKGTEPPQTFVTAPAAWPIAFDIAILAPETISITGRELESVWKGKLTISGNTDAPLFFGDFKVVEGYYLFNGKNFSIDQGSITLAGEIDKKTSLYVIAAKDLGKVTVEVILKGSAKNPAISFRSNPPMSQREILSWILFNRGTSEISPFQGSQLRESITNLSSTHKGPDVLTKIRTALGIDRIDIYRGSGDDDSAVGFQVGKYISQNVFVSINKSDVNRLAIEAALQEHIKLQAEIGDNAEGNLMLKWKRDY